MNPSGLVVVEADSSTMSARRLSGCCMNRQLTPVCGDGDGAVTISSIDGYIALAIHA